MKKILFATSALVALTGAAAAEITLSGDARLGMRYDDFQMFGDKAAGEDGWNVVSRARVQFIMTGDTDSGLSFGAKFRAHEANDARNYSKPVGEVWIEGAYGKLSAGDVDSAVEAAVGHLPVVGLTSFDDLNEFSYTSSDSFEKNNNKGLLYEYKYGDVSFYASFQDQYQGEDAAKTDNGKDSFALGVGYSVGQYTFGVGYSQDGDSKVILPIASADIIGGWTGTKSKTWAISGGTEWNGFVFKAVYMNSKVDGTEVAAGFNDGNDFDIKQYGVGAEYEMANGVGIQGFYRGVDVESYGKRDILALGATYDLGGGATLKGGVAHIKDKFDEAGVDKEDGTVADFGLEFKF